MTSRRTLHAMIQESLTAELPMNKFRRTLTEDEQRALDQILRSAAPFKPTAESLTALSSLETALLVTALRQSQKIERLEILLQRLTVRVVELYASRERVPEHSP